MTDNPGLRNSRPPGRPKTTLTLSPEERETLTEWAKSAPDAPSTTAEAAGAGDPSEPSEPGQLALRSRIILACATGAPNTRVAEHLGVSRPTVGKWRSRFVERRLDGLADDPRPGRPPSMSIEEIRAVLKAHHPGRHHSRATTTGWTRRELARRTGLSVSTIGRIWGHLDIPNPET
ncbi:helix-turn-helix domain-containing protein [Corynebacterium sp. AOP40-9SA-29]|uniref:helix-turn-helix domain-containing protein n=1 Tax=Corynebacterium sp. AOP40-9SA-29 TaxID=3457677 RepID=UPI004033C67E